MEERIYEMAVESFGEKAQLLMAIEEMAELTMLLSKKANGRYYSHEVLLEEVADVNIMLEQLNYMLRNDSLEIAKIKEMKLFRLEQLLSSLIKSQD